MTSQVIKRVEATTTNLVHFICTTKDKGSLLLVAERRHFNGVDDIMWSFPYEKVGASENFSETRIRGLMEIFSGVTFISQDKFFPISIVQNAFTAKPLVQNHFCGVVCSKYRNMQVAPDKWTEFCWIHPHQVLRMKIDSSLRDESSEDSICHLVLPITQKILKRLYVNGGGSGFEV